MDSDDGYGDMHKMVLQGLMSAGFLDAKGVKNLFIGACHSLKLNTEERTSMPYVQKVVREINERIKPYDMAIRSASCELTGKKFYVFLVTVEKPIMKLQTLFSRVELELFQKIMNSALRKHRNFAVPLIECLNLSKELDARNFNMNQAEEFIMKMITLQYLAKYFIDTKKPVKHDKHDKKKEEQEFDITLGIRTIREFEPILREVYDDVITACHLCKMIMIHGYQCSKCTIQIHKACFTKYLTQTKNCPGCRTVWKEKDMVRRIRDGGEDDVESPVPVAVATTSTARSSQRSRQDANLEDMPVLETMVSPTPTPKRGRTTKSKVKSPVANKKKVRGRRQVSSEEEATEESD